MSADKNKSLFRRIQLLRRAVGCYSWQYTDFRNDYARIDEVIAKSQKELSGKLYFHCEGGMAIDDPDIQRLVADGHLGPINPRTPAKKFREFLRFFGWSNNDGSIAYKGTSICGHAPRTSRNVTEAGIKFLQDNDYKFEYKYERRR